MNEKVVWDIRKMSKRKTSNCEKVEKKVGKRRKGTCRTFPA
jgi:hypothetical protein